MLVSLDVEGPVATVTLRRTDKLNSLNAEMIAELGAALRRGAHEARVVVLRAEPGVKVFSAGHDISDVPVGVAAAAWENPVEEVIAGVPRLPVPVIAAVEGTVWGAACNLVVACDLVVACENSSFAITPAKLGVPYFSAGVSIFARSLPLHVVKSMFFTAQPLSAIDAARYGMVHEVVADEPALSASVAALAERVASLAPLTIESVKAELAALDPFAGVSPQQTATLRERAWHSDDVKEGVAAFQERRAPNFQGK